MTNNVILSPWLSNARTLYASHVHSSVPNSCQTSDADNRSICPSVSRRARTRTSGCGGDGLALFLPASSPPCRLESPPMPRPELTPGGLAAPLTLCDVRRLTFRLQSVGLNPAADRSGKVLRCWVELQPRSAKLNIPSVIFFSSLYGVCISCLSQELYLPYVISVHNPSRLHDGSFDTWLLLVDARCTLPRTH